MQPLSLSFFEEDAKGAAALTAVPRVHLVLADLEAVAHHGLAQSLVDNAVLLDRRAGHVADDQLDAHAGEGLPLRTGQRGERRRRTVLGQTRPRGGAGGEAALRTAADERRSKHTPPEADSGHRGALCDPTTRALLVARWRCQAARKYVTACCAERSVRGPRPSWTQVFKYGENRAQGEATNYTRAAPRKQAASGVFSTLRAEGIQAG